MTSKYQKRHYEDIAEIIATSKSREEITIKLMDLFRADNPLFDSGRFLRASKMMHVIGVEA